jgi:MFS family permease
MRQLWGIKTYRLLFFAGFLSELGTYISEVAILLRIFELVGQQKQFLGITQAVFLVFMILGTLLGGVWGERNSKHKILMLCEVARIPILSAMLVWDTSPWMLILGNGGVAFFSGMFNPTRQALMNQILPSSHIAKANSLFSVSFAFLHAFGPIAGALLYASIGHLSPILLFDLATYFVGLGFLAKLSALLTQQPHPTILPHAHSGFIHDLRDAFALVRSQPEFFWILLRCTLASTALGIVIPLMLPFTTEILQLPPSYYGLLLGVFGAGGAVGSLLVPTTLKRFSVETALRLLTLGEGFSLLVWTSGTIPALAFGFAFLYGALLFGRITCQLDFVSLRLPHGFNARANSFLDLAMVIPNVLGAVVVATAGAQLNTRMLLQGSAITFITLMLILCGLELSKRQASTGTPSA